LAAVALGRLYWSEEQVLYSDVNAIIVGLEEHYKLLQSVFGSKSSSKKPVVSPATGKPIKLTPKLFDAMFGGKPKRRLK